ncbi:hypothetical protein PV328_000742 [Microctonus aethiopoides]|uniref:Borealin n=1 Tax=Microctonus aethiopoides TaxID=144406 RepID=A0AA39FVI1_9HYME|nr:hypothetical protein PV328_000742 [Microctonus aethiopoides]
MPRTKQVRNNNSNNFENNESELIVKDFERQTKLKLRKIEAECDMLFQKFINKIDLSLSTMPDEIRNKITLGDLMAYRFELANENDENNVTSTSDDHANIIIEPQTAVKNKKLSKRQTAASTDDGYVSESGVQNNKKRQQHVSRIDTVKSTSKRQLRPERSSSRSTTEGSRPRTRSSSNQRGTMSSKINSKMVTPAPSRQQNNEYSLVTPKVKPNTPLNVLRRPREGEMALSMQGSPLLVSAINPDRTANINVPLTNGNIMSLLPNDGLRLSNIPRLDDETMRQLKTLKSHIEKVIGKH